MTVDKVVERKLSAREVAEQILLLCKTNGYIVRPYEGEVSVTCIEGAEEWNIDDSADISDPYRYGVMSIDYL